MKLDLSNDFERKKGIAYFKKLLDQKAKVEVKKVSEKRSINQNSYLHVCLNLSGIYFGYTLEEVKYLFKKNFGLVYTKNNEQFIRSSADLDTKEMTDFIDFIREQNSIEGNYIPSPEEYLKNQFAIDKEIENNKNFLL